MNSAYFLTGTDTEIGKTFITCALLHRARLDGLTAAGLKPIAAGNVELPRAIVNPYCFGPAIAPHIAAAEEGRCIDFGTIVAACDQARQRADLIIVEGVGGFCVPLSQSSSTADLTVALGLPVILVVGMRLGCINHALLTAEAIAARGLRLAGWVANCVDPAMPRRAENIAALEVRLGAPLLGAVPHLPDGNPALASSHLKLPESRGI